MSAIDVVDDHCVHGYDIIGDVHGCAIKLERLLGALGYRPDAAGTYRHPHRQAIFVGDLIDREPQQLRVLEIAKAMTDSGSAQIVMGNHEFNAITYATEHPQGSSNHLRKHNEKHNNQHEAFLELDTDQRDFYVEWFKSLPLWLDLGDLRVVHACWHDDSLKYLEGQLGSNRFSTTEQFVRAATERDQLYDAIEVVLKGPEISLHKYDQPSYLDKGGDERDTARLRWWDPDATTLRELAEVDGFTLPDGTAYPTPPDAEVAPGDRDYVYAGATPVFYGHYWRRGEPEFRRDWTDHTACVDFSAAKKGPLMAYRWSGETKIDPKHYFSAAQ